MKRHVYLLTALVILFAIPAGTQEKSADALELTHCKGWNVLDGTGKTLFVYAYNKGLTLGARVGAAEATRNAESATKAADKAFKLFFPQKLNLQEVIGRVNDYCSDQAHEDRLLTDAIGQIAEDMNKP